ncbi:MAG: DUF4861 domain-containing protein [Planctomycetes bacterium]|nr:DUF4861 domain-containing protein [Planctomycetota bacterium]
MLTRSAEHPETSQPVAYQAVMAMMALLMAIHVMGCANRTRKPGAHTGDLPRLAVKVENSSGEMRAKEPITVSIPPTLAGRLEGRALELRTSSGTEIACQVDDVTGDGIPDELFFELDLKPNETIALEATPLRGKVTGLVEKKVHALVQRTERITRAAWESELMAYCTYGAAKLDFLGKVSPRLSTEYFFGREPHSPHEFSSTHGQDFMPIGMTLGGGGIFLSEDPRDRKRMSRPWTRNSFSKPDALSARAPYVTAEFEFTVLASGPLRAVVRADIKNWTTPFGRYEASQVYSIYANHRYTRGDIELTVVHSKAEDLLLGVGFRALPEERAFKATSSYCLAMSENVFDPAANGVVARFHGMALLYSPLAFKQALDTPEDGNNHIVLLDGIRGRTTIFYCAAWERDGEIASAQEWEQYVSALAERLHNPPQVEFETR